MTIRERVLQVLAEVAPGTDPGAVGGDVDLRDALDLDSMDMLRFVAGLEGQFGVTIPEHDARRLLTIAAAVDYVAARGPAPG